MVQTTIASSQSLLSKRPEKLLSKQDTTKALVVINKRILRFESPDLYRLRAEVKHRRGDLFEALVDFENYCKLKGNCGTVQYKKAQIQYALEQYAVAINSLLSHPRLNRDENALFLLGLSKLKLYQYESALNSFEDALTLNPSWFEAQYNAGLSAFNIGDFISALDYFMTAANILPGDESVWMAIGSTHYKLEEYQKSNKAYRQAVAINSGSDQALLNIGVNYYYLGDSYNMCEYWQRAQSKGSVSAEFELSKYCAQGKKED